MSIYDDNDGKPYLYVRQLLTKELYRLSGEYFGNAILQEQIKDEPVAKMLSNMFGTTSTDQMQDELQEVVMALKILSEQSEDEKVEDK